MPQLQKEGYFLSSFFAQKDTWLYPIGYTENVVGNVRLWA